MFEFTPRTERELTNLLLPGHYKYKVIKSTLRKSKEELPYIALTLKVWDEFSEAVVFFNLSSKDNKFAQRLNRRFCYSNGMDSLYEKGSYYASECEGRSGTLEITISIDQTKQYPDKNIVVDFLPVTEEETSIVSNHDNISIANDDMPF